MRDADLLEPIYGPMLNTSDLMNLPNYHAYVSALFNGEVTKPFNICTQLDQSSVDETTVEKIKAGMTAYGRPKDLIDKLIELRFDLFL